MSAPIVTTLIWSGITITVTHYPNRLGELDYITLASEPRVCLPITQTGFLAHFLSPDEIEPFGTAQAFVEAWLEEEAQLPEWQAYALASKQLSLF